MVCRTTCKYTNDKNIGMNTTMTNEPYLVTTDQDRDAITALHLICFDSTEQPKL